MKKNILYIVFTFAFLVLGCEKKLTAYDIEYRHQEITQTSDFKNILYQYPTFQNYPKLNAVIYELLDYAALLSDEMAVCKKLYNSSLPDTSNWFVKLSYEAPEIVGTAINVLFYLSSDTGVGQPFTEVLSVNYDAENDEVLSVKKLLENEHSEWLTVLSNFCITELEKQLAKDKDFISDSNWIKNGASANIKNFNAFKIQKRGIEIIFSPCQVASFETGEVHVTVPYKVFK